MQKKRIYFISFILLFFSLSFISAECLKNGEMGYIDLSSNPGNISYNCCEGLSPINFSTSVSNEVSYVSSGSLQYKCIGVGTSCGTVTPGYQDECCVERGFDGWNSSISDCFNKRIIPKNESTTCLDSDGGKEKYIFGKVTIRYNPETCVEDEDDCDFAPTALYERNEEDQCTAEKTGLYEKYCDDNALSTEVLDCPFGCEGGVCNKDTEIKCTNNNDCIEIVCPSEGFAHGICIDGSCTNPKCSDSVNCQGCLGENKKCYPYGYRKSDIFCSDIDDKFISQIDSDEKCENSFECKSNLCVSEKCVSESLLKRILSWFIKIFGDDEDCEVDCDNAKSKNEKILVFIDFKFSSGISDELIDWENDLKKEEIDYEQVIIPDNESPANIRERIKEEYDKQEGLTYVTFIGDIPYLYSEFDFLKETISDKYYADLDTSYKYNSETNKFYLNDSNLKFSSTQYNELVVSRILPPRGYDFSIREQMIKDYLIKVHLNRDFSNYQKVGLVEAMRGINEEEARLRVLNFVQNNTLYNEVNEADAIVGLNAETIIKNYKEALMKNYELMFVTIHGNPEEQATEFINNLSAGLTFEDISEDIKPAVYFLLSCNNGDIASEHYFAGELLFRGQTLQVFGHSRPTLQANYLSSFLTPDYVFLDYLENGGTISKYQFIAEEALLVFGDPTLRLREISDKDFSLEINNKILDFGYFNYQDKVLQNVTFENKGDTPIYVKYFSLKADKFIKWANSVDANVISPSSKSFLIDPQEEMNLTFGFDDVPNSLVGDLIKAKFQILTDNPKNPFYYVTIQGTRIN